MCLGNSFNIPAVKTEYATGTQYIANTELAMGVKSLNQNCGPNGQYVNWPATTQWAATLGSLTCGITLLDLADGAATLGDLGVQHNPMPVTSITAQATGQTMFTYNPAAAGRQVIPANVAYIMDEITSNDNNRIREFGRNGYLTLGARRVSAKTGTADFFMDNLTVGWTPNLLTAVWVGTRSEAASRTRITTTWRHQIARGNVDPTRRGRTTPIRSARATWRITASSRSTRAPGLRPPRWRRLRIQRRRPDLARVHVGSAQGRPRHLVQAARRRDPMGGGTGDDADFYLPGTQPGANTNCTYYAPNSATHRDLHLRRASRGAATRHNSEPQSEPEPQSIAGRRPSAHSDADALAGYARSGSVLAGKLPDRVEVVENRERGIGFHRGIGVVIAHERRERGMHVADHHVVTRGASLHLVQAEERPPVVEGDVGRRREHRGVREQRELRGSRLSATEGPKQPGEPSSSISASTTIRPEPSGVSWSMTASSTATSSSRCAELAEIEQIRGDAQHPETFAGDRVTAVPVGLGDPDHERLGAGGAGGSVPGDPPPEHGEVGVEGSLIDPLPARSRQQRAPRPSTSAPRSGFRRAPRGACPADRAGSDRGHRGSTSAGWSRRSCPVARRDHSPKAQRARGVSQAAIGRLNRVTDAAPPNYAAPPPGPTPVALAIAHDLVTRYRLRLADPRDGRLGELLGHYVLAAAMWNGPRAALVAFYEPPADPARPAPTSRRDATRRALGLRPPA